MAGIGELRLRSRDSGLENDDPRTVGSGKLKGNKSSDPTNSVVCRPPLP